MSERLSKMNAEDIHGLARRSTTSQFDVRGELNPVSSETISGNRRTLVRIQSRSAGRGFVTSVPTRSEQIAYPNEPVRDGEDSPDHKTGHHGAERERETSPG